MKTILLIAFLSGYSTCFCQENSLFMTDSLIAVYKVKTRTKTINSISGYPYTVNHYSESGKLILTEILDDVNDSVMLRTTYFYNNMGLLDSSIMLKCGKYQSTFLIPNVYNKSIDALKNYYQYDQNNRLLKTVTKDDQYRLNYETLYTYDPYSYNILYYSLTGYVFKVVECKFEHGKVPLGLVESELDETGKIINQSKTIITNSYNAYGQLESANYESPDCKSNRKYSYYKNGLLKSKKKDKCSQNWTFSYTYY